MKTAYSVNKLQSYLTKYKLYTEYIICKSIEYHGNRVATILGRPARIAIMYLYGIHNYKTNILLVLDT